MLCVGRVNNRTFLSAAMMTVEICSLQFRNNLISLHAPLCLHIFFISNGSTDTYQHLQSLHYG